MQDTVTVPGDCFKCEVEVVADFYCYGCKEYICNDCNTNEEATGPGHPVGLHFAVSECCGDYILMSTECAGCGVVPCEVGY